LFVVRPLSQDRENVIFVNPGHIRVNFHNFWATNVAEHLPLA